MSYFQQTDVFSAIVYSIKYRSVGLRLLYLKLNTRRTYNIPFDYFVLNQMLDERYLRRAQQNDCVILNVHNI